GAYSGHIEEAFDERRSPLERWAEGSAPFHLHARFTGHWRAEIPPGDYCALLQPTQSGGTGVVVNDLEALRPERHVQPRGRDVVERHYPVLVPVRHFAHESERPAFRRA